MGFLSKRTLLAAAILLLAMSSLRVSAFPSGLSYPPTFHQKNGEWYDSWEFNRNYYGDSDGYMPNLAYETLGNNKELAYSIGERFISSYASDTRRAEAILQYVQRWTNYGYDEDNVFMRGQSQDEWAWNADEMAHMFNETTNTVAIGDCEDMAFLCATLYIAAGYDVALVLAPGHVALLIWLPEYSNANIYWDILDGRGEGWIWVEATGGNNPLGWTPPDYNDGYWEAYPLNIIITSVSYSPRDPQAEDDVTVTASISLESSQISQVVLKYSINGDAYRVLQMSSVGSSYRATIPKQPIGTSVDFRVSVTDTEGNVSESGRISYVVGGMEIPGFPFESIIIGLIIGLAVLYRLATKKNALPVPSSTGYHAARSRTA